MQDTEIRRQVVAVVKNPQHPADAVGLVAGQPRGPFGASGSSSGFPVIPVYTMVMIRW